MSKVGVSCLQKSLSVILRLLGYVEYYGRRCCTLLNWIESGEKVIFGPDLVEEAEATVVSISSSIWLTPSVWPSVCG
jgi:hypothetical protein